MRICWKCRREFSEQERVLDCSHSRSCPEGGAYYPVPGVDDPKDAKPKETTE